MRLGEDVNFEGEFSPSQFMSPDRKVTVLKDRGSVKLQNLKNRSKEVRPVFVL
jgi:hypothetical protein